MRHGAKRRHSDHGRLRRADLGTNRPSACGGVGVGPAVGTSDFCATAAGRSRAESSIDERSDGRDFAGKRALDQTRSRSSNAAGGAMAVSWIAGCGADPVSVASIPVFAGISKSGALLLATDVLTESA